jgi:hypothetical protein
MLFKKKKISALPQAESFTGLFTIGVDSKKVAGIETNRSVKVGLEFIKDAADDADDAAANANAAATSANQAAAAANQAREAANAAAASANQAATTANTAATNANAARDAANTAAANANTAKDAANAAATAANTAAANANNAAASVNAAKDAANAAAANANAAATAANTAASNANTAKDAANAAATAATAAATNANNAATAATTAKNAANAAATAANTAATNANTAKDAANAAATAATTAATAANTAATNANAAKDAANTAATNANTAKDAANTAATAANAAAANAVLLNSNPPKIQTGTWWTYNLTQKKYVDTTLPSRGEQGKGPIVLANGNYGNWNDDTSQYEDSGVEAAATVDLDGVGVAFTEATSKATIASGETIPVIFGKIKKWFSSFGALAWKSSIDYTSTDITNKPDIPAAQLQSDWNQASAASKDYIKNKPSLFNGAFGSLTGKPTTIAGYGITNAYTKDEVDQLTGGADVDLTDYDTRGVADGRYTRKPIVKTATLASLEWVLIANRWKYTVNDDDITDGSCVEVHSNRAGQLAMDNAGVYSDISGEAGSFTLTAENIPASDVIIIYTIFS